MMQTFNTVNSYASVSAIALRPDAIARNDPEHAFDDSGEMSELDRRVLEGLRAGEFHLAFQGAHRSSDGGLARLEAQVRWTHPDYGLLLPGIFILPLEHPEVAQAMASFVVDGVCRELRDCLASGLPVQPIAFTVPAHVAITESFASQIRRVANSYGIPINLIEVDIPDSADAAKLLSLRTLTSSLRNVGVSIAIGKWGNGESSLAQLAALEVDTVTLARELMAAVPRDPRASAVMSAVLNLLETLDLRVLVYGVDTDEQLAWLSQWPNTLAQGVVFARPQSGLANVIASKRIA